MPLKFVPSLNVLKYTLFYGPTLVPILMRHWNPVPQKLLYADVDQLITALPDEKATVVERAVVIKAPEAEKDGRSEMDQLVVVRGR